MQNFSACREVSSWGRVQSLVKLVLQITLGVLLAAGLAFGAARLYGWYTTRSTANEYEWKAAHDLMDTGVKVCSVSSNTAQCLYGLFGSCKKFHINDADCKQLMSEAVEKAANHKP